MNKKILFVIGAGIYPDIVGGMEIFNYYLIKKICKRCNVFSFAEKRYDFDDVGFLKCFNIKPIKLFFPIQLFISLLACKFDRVVYSYSSAHWFIWWAFTKISTILKIPYIVVIHYGKKPPKENFLAYYNFFNFAERVIAVSDDIKNNFDKKYSISCEVIPPLVPFEEAKKDKLELRIKYGVKSDSTVICMVGSIKAMKNPDTLLDAVKLMGKEEFLRINPYIVYAGHGDMLDELRKKAEDYGLTEHVSFLGFVPKENVNEIMALSDIYVIASDFEGTSVSLLEAMYNGKPIIASNTPGINDTITPKESLMFPVRDAVLLKDSIVHMFDNKELRDDLSKNARQRYLDLYNYDEVLERYITILNN